MACRNRNRSYTHWMFDTTKFQIGFRQSHEFATKLKLIVDALIEQQSRGRRGDMRRW